MRLLKLYFVFCLLALLAVSANSQVGAGLDATFAPELTTDSVDLLQMKLQPDGKLLVYSSQIPNRVIRLNSDGSRDTTFNCPACSIISNGQYPTLSAGSLAVQDDGKILVAGTEAYTNSPKIIRVNADGSLDSTFSNSTAPIAGFTGSIIIYGSRSDGKIYVGLQKRTDYNIVTGVTVFRLNVDGSADSGFTPIVTNQVSGSIFSVNLKILPDGRVFLYGSTSYGTLALLNEDGSKSSSLESPALSAPNNFPGYFTDIALRADGKIIATGFFNQVNGVSREAVVVLNSDGSVDTQFSPSGLFSGFEVQRQTDSIQAVADNKFLVGGSSTIRKIQRLNANGTIDTTYTPPTNFINSGGFRSFTADAQGRAYVFGTFQINNISAIKLVRLNADGTLDTTYSPDLGAVGRITAFAVQGDGKIIAAGYFSKVSGAVRNRIARLNADGTLDTSFTTGSGITSGEILDIGVQPDGKIIIGGSFPEFNGVNRLGVARLNSDGSLDNSFNVSSTASFNYVYAVAIQSDGKFILGGEFSFNSRQSLARFNADGTVDTTFTPLLSDSNSRIYDLIVQSDGKIVVAGRFNGIGGINRNNIARLNSDGSADSSFNYGSTSEIYQIIQQPDGKYLIRPRGVILRLNQNGSQDNDFVYAEPQGNLDPQFFTMSLQPNGTIIVGGTFEAVNGQPRRNIARLLPNGRVDVYYAPRKTDYSVRTSIVQADGKVIIGGEFTSVSDVTRYGVARILQSPAIVPPTNFDFDGDGKADISLFRPSSGTWFLQQSTNGFTAVQFGDTNDKVVSADYDGDGKTDLAVYRNGTWYLLRSTAGFTGITFGDANDIPQPADVDGDGKAELIVWRPSNGVWYIFNQAANQFNAVQFGTGTDKPVIADYDGDGKSDLAVVRQTGGASTWYIIGSTRGFYGVQFGADTDKLVPADYDGDGKIDIAVFRPSNGFWYLQRSTSGFTGLQWGAGTDLPVPADYNGDGKAELAVFRPSNGTWYLYSLQSNQPNYVSFGQNGDKPVPNAFIP